MQFLGLIPKKFLGIDIGTSAVKLVELSRWAGRNKLENYGEISASVLYKKPFRTFEKNTLSLVSEDIAKAVKAVIEEANIKTRKAVFTIPDFSTFFTSFELPSMSIEELPQAVKSEARRHVPLPLAEVTLDWQLLNKETRREGQRFEILLVTVPNEVINQYKEIAQDSDLELLALEAEVFGLMRSLINKEEKRTVALIDIGARSTTCSIVDKRTLKISHSFDISGDILTERISKALSLDYETARGLKTKYGISSLIENSEKKSVKEVLTPLIALVIREIDKVFKEFYLRKRKEVEKIILAGGVAMLPGLQDSFKDYFKKEIEIANPFSNIFFSPILEENLKEMGPAYAIAVGAALRGLES
ncbi:MAG: type IV pilus assembly protein PilM [Candidatus Nealsonbacteria bacterium]